MLASALFLFACLSASLSAQSIICLSTFLLGRNAKAPFYMPESTLDEVEGNSNTESEVQDPLINTVDQIQGSSALQDTHSC